MERLTTFVLAHRLPVILLWAAIAVAGAATAGRTTDALSFDFALPGQEAATTNEEIVGSLGGGGIYEPLLLTVAATDGTDFRTADGANAFSAAAERIAAAEPGTRVVTPATAGPTGQPTLVSPDGSRAVALLYPPVAPGPEPYAVVEPAIESAAAAMTIAGAMPELTGTLLLLQGGGEERSILVEIAFGAGGALIVLVSVFGSLMAGLPLLVAAVSILATYLALLGLTTLTDVSAVLQYLVALIGLGVAIDYSLLIVTRWREERARGSDNDTAIRITMATAGRSVVFSGLTVTVSLAALVAVPVPFLRSIGLGGLLIPLLSVLTALTLVPVLLRTVGPRLEWPRRQLRDPSSRAWGRVAAAIVRRPWVVIAATGAVLLLLALPVTQIRLGTPETTAYGTASSAARAASEISESGMADGLLRPTEILAATEEAPALAQTLAGVEGVAGTSAPGWTAGGLALIQVWFVDDPASEAGTTTLDRVIETAEAAGGRVGGTPAQDAAFVRAVYGSAPLVILAIILVTFLLLARALRSLWLPVKALVLNALSLAAAYGLTVLIWQEGIGTEQLFGVGGTGGIVIWIPVAVFAFLFGLSTDYEVFILSRMREAYDQHGDTPRAVVNGISYTGRLVTSAALILFLSFVALSTVPAVEVKILATALALGILIDALIVRMLLTPALIVVLGRASWTMPGWLATLLRVDPDSPAPRH